MGQGHYKGSMKSVHGRGSIRQADDDNDNDIKYLLYCYSRWLGRYYICSKLILTSANALLHIEERKSLRLVYNWMFSISHFTEFIIYDVPAIDNNGARRVWAITLSGLWHSNSRELYCYSLRVVILELIQRRDAQPTTLHILLISLSETPCQNDFLNIFLPENVPN